MPGDLGRPFLRAQQEGGAVTAPPGPNGPSPEEQARLAEQQRLRQEAEAAARGALFVQVRQRTDQQGQGETIAPTPTVTAARDPFAPLPGSAESQHQDETFAQNGQDRKSAFLSASVDAKIYASGRLQTPASPFQVMAGTIIPAAMVTGLNSDLPGQAIATVTEPVYDSVSGRTLLIPQGSRLLGTYDAQVAYGQSRILLVWTRLVMPDGSSIVLDRLPGADTREFAGLEDETDNHWGKLLAGAVLSTLLGVGAELGSQNSWLGGTGQQTVVVATSRSAEESVNQVGQQITRRNLNIQPTLTVRPGFPVRVIVNKDLLLRPYGSMTMRTRASIAMNGKLRLGPLPKTEVVRLRDRGRAVDEGGWHQRQRSAGGCEADRRVPVADRDPLGNPGLASFEQSVDPREIAGTNGRARRQSRQDRPDRARRADGQSEPPA